MSEVQYMVNRVVDGVDRGTIFRGTAQQAAYEVCQCEVMRATFAIVADGGAFKRRVDEVRIERTTVKSTPYGERLRAEDAPEVTAWRDALAMALRHFGLAA